MPLLYNDVDPVLAAQIAARRLNAIKSLPDWCRLCGYEPARFHLFLLAALEKVLHEQNQRIMVFMPPRHAKSTYCSVLFPPWAIAQEKDFPVLCFSHSASLSQRFGRQARNLIEREHLALGYDLCEDSRAADEWTTTNGGYFFSAGVGGASAGRGGKLIIIDDPLGSKEDAYSLKKREAIWDWYNFDLRSRIEPGASILVIMTRWHEDDLAGKLLKEEGKDWKVISFTRIAEKNDILGREEGAPLWPDRHGSESDREAMKDKRVFAALHQQNPTPEQGVFFMKEWIEPFAYDKGELPDDLSIYQAGDLAVSEEDQNNPSCIGTAGFGPNNTLWLLDDLKWDRWNSADLVRVIIGLMLKHSPRYWWGEKGQIQKSIGPFLKQQMREQGAFTYIETFASTKDKTACAQSIRGMFELGCVRLPRYAPWYDQAVDQLLKFPLGAEDDFVDMLSRFGEGIQKMIAARPKSIVQNRNIPIITTFRPTMREMKAQWDWEDRKEELVLLDR